MISLGGAIGTGLFLSSGTNIAQVIIQFIYIIVTKNI
jgi:amino acid permease